ncbi:MAG: hypothetical protein AAGE65_13210 [Planctomycetota bacterium]
MDERQDQLIHATRRLLGAIATTFLILVVSVSVCLLLDWPIPVALATFFAGALGGFIGIQRRLKSLEALDLALLTKSWCYVLLSPLVGGILAMLVYVLFISGLIRGPLFPEFTHLLDPSAVGLQRLFQSASEDFSDYAKLTVWCFLAGYSERFVVNILGVLEGRARQATGLESADE